MWPESSPVKAVNLVKKNCYDSRDIEFFLRDNFFGAPCIDWTSSKLIIGIMSLRSSLPRAATSAISFKGNTSKIRVE